MAATPQWKVFNPRGEYVAACKYLEDAAVLVAFYGDGAEIRDGHSVRDRLWKEGAETQPAGESYDFVRDRVMARRTACRPDVCEAA